MAIQDDDARQQFSERLNQAMDAAGYPVRGRARELSKKLGVSDKGAGKWLKGEAIPETSKIPIIAQILNVNSEWLLSGRGVIAPIEDFKTSDSLGKLIGDLQQMERENKLPQSIVMMLQNTLNTVTSIQDNQEKLESGEAKKSA